MSDWANVAAQLANKNHTKSLSNGNVKPATGQNGSPSMSSASAKAALLAHKAALSHQADTHLSETAAQESLKDARDRALLAATKSFRQQKVLEKKSPAGLSASDQRDAELASRRITARQQETQSRRDIIHIKPEMLTEHPPIRMEVEEKRHNDALHASALSLARTVYNQRTAEQNVEPSAKDQAKQYVSLQDAAQKLAAQRIAKINESTSNLPPRSKSTRTTTNLLQKVRRGHRRSTSDDDLTSEYTRKELAYRKSQMSAVESKRSEDQQAERSRIMAAAERKVQAQMQTLDATVFAETGKMSPAMMSDWDSQARVRRANNPQVISMRDTQADSAVDVGAGKVVDRADVEYLAEQRVGPTLRGIDEAVEKRRQEDADKKERIEEEKRFARQEREKRKEDRAEQKRLEG